MNLLQLVLITAAWTVVLYIINCLLAHKVKKIEVGLAVYYVSTMAMLGVVGEFLIDTIYHLVNGRALWQYQILPMHHAYTSIYSLFIWGIVGFHIYLIHDTLAARNITSLNKLAFIFCFEAIILEAFFNLSFLATFGKFVYYYLPNDIWHITSLEALPLYLVAGYISIYVLKKFNARPRSSSLAFTSIALAAVFLK